MTSMMPETKLQFCLSNYEASKCGNLLSNKNQTISLYNLCLEEMFQDESYQEAGYTGLHANSIDQCKVYPSMILKWTSE